MSNSAAIDSISTRVIANARVLTLLPARKERSCADLGLIEAADVLIDSEAGIIREVRPHSAQWVSAQAKVSGVKVLDARGRVLMPGFVDCHTHACFAGSRIDEWERKLAGQTYQQIAAAGGGIMSTVRATQQADVRTLSASLRDRLAQMASFGTTTVEVKSGYGLQLDHELKMLEAIYTVKNSSDESAASLPTVSPTALLGHAIPPDVDSRKFVDHTIEQTLRVVASTYPGICIDAYCENGAWSVEDCVRLFERARSLNSPGRVHTDQFNSLGMIEHAIRLNLRSVDHLEAATISDLHQIARSDLYAVALPCCGFHLDNRYADAGSLWKFGAKVCIATNFNPGSAPCLSMPMAIALAVRHGGLSVSQAIIASTLNPARLLGYDDRGYIHAGARADLVLLSSSDERILGYEFGMNPVRRAWIAGRPTYPTQYSS